MPQTSSARKLRESSQGPSRSSWRRSEPALRTRTFTARDGQTARSEVRFAAKTTTTDGSLSRRGRQLANKAAARPSRRGLGRLVEHAAGGELLEGPRLLAGADTRGQDVPEQDRTRDGRDRDEHRRTLSTPVSYRPHRFGFLANFAGFCRNSSRACSGRTIEN